MSRQDREAWQAMLEADPALKAAWDGFTGQLEDTGPLMTKPGRYTDQEREAAVRSMKALRSSAQRIYAAAGLPPEDAHEAD